MGPDSGWRLIAAYPRHHSRRDRWLMIREQVAEGAPNRYDPLPNHQVIRVTARSGGKLVVATLDPKDSEISHLIDPDELCGYLAPIAQRHEDIIGTADTHLNRQESPHNHQLIRVTEWSGGKLVVPTLDPKDSEIIHLIDPDELCGVLAPIAQRHEDIIGPADHMLIRQDDPITPDDEA